MENELNTIVATNIVPPELTITYDDMHSLWGGTTITVRGDGAMETRTREIGAHEAQLSRKQIDERELINLIRLLIEVRAWEQVTAEASPVPDESRATLMLDLVDNSTRVWERVNEMAANNRLVQIKSLLEILARPSTTGITLPF